MGYANLFKELAEYCGFKCQHVSGIVAHSIKDSMGGEEARHSWNIITIGDKDVSDITEGFLTRD